MSKVILGIHGLANKPVKKDLADWWKQSIEEGLTNIACQVGDVEFRMVHWADLLYKNPLHSDEAFSFDALYNSEPYRAASAGELKEFKAGLGTWLRAAASDIGGSATDLLKKHVGMNRFADWVIGKVAKDLAFYYDDKRRIVDRNQDSRRAMDVLRDELKTAIRLEHDKGNDMMIVAHSMGSIIAYDALRDLGREPDNAIRIEHLVTIGSPLGLPHVKGKILEERDYAEEVRTPSVVVGGWTNFADLKDPVALDSRLKDDYAANQLGIRVVDDEVTNDFHTGAGMTRHNNHHKSYGYLRTPEFSRVVASFLG